jgi:hexosaminidase
MLKVSRESVITANGSAGFIYGLETIRQLLPCNRQWNGDCKYNMGNSCNRYKDKPRFQWRGLMLDLSDIFFKKEYILKLLPSSDA